MLATSCTHIYACARDRVNAKEGSPTWVSDFPAFVLRGIKRLLCLSHRSQELHAANVQPLSETRSEELIQNGEKQPRRFHALHTALSLLLPALYLS